MPAIILFSCSGLLVYWASRVFVVMRGPAERVEEVLDADLWWGRSVIDTLRQMFSPLFVSGAV